MKPWIVPSSIKKNSPKIKKKLRLYPKSKWREIIPLSEIPPSIGEKIYKIVTRYSYRSNYINYSYKDKLISEAIYTCCRYADRFDPEKSSNPFSYFTMVACNSFIKCINEEKKISNIKKKIYDKNLADQNIVNKNKIDYDEKIEQEWSPLYLTSGKKKIIFKTEESYKKYIKRKKEKIK